MPNPRLTTPLLIAAPVLLALLSFTPPPGTTTTSQSLPVTDTSSCTLSDSLSLPDSLSLYSSDTPRIGPHDASVRIVEFFDPNCPHCRTFHNRLLPRVKEATPSGSFSLYLRPYPLSKRSYPQIFSLYYAHEVGQLPDLLDVMFTFGPPTRITRQTFHYYAKAADMRPDSTFAAVSSSRFESRMARSIDVANAAGVKGTPTVFVNGRKVPRSSFNPSCIVQFIKQNS
jgi:protein-disulfide isomerase